MRISAVVLTVAELIPVLSLCDACGEPIVGDYVKIQTTGDCYCDECFMMKSLGEDDP